MRAFLIIFLCASPILVSAQPNTKNDITSVLESKSIDFLNSFVQMDWEKYTRYTYPNIIELAGGKEMLVKLAHETLDMYKSIGYNIKSGTITGDINIIDSGENIQAIIPSTLLMDASGKNEVKTEIKLFAISSDGGASWKFVDLSQYDQKSIKTFVPEFNDSLFLHWK